MNKPLALSICFFLLVQLIASGSSLAQDYPKLVEDRYLAPAMPPFFIPQLDIEYELSGESRKKYDEFVEKFEDFKEQFEEERQTLESQYNAASGEAKINAAYELIELVVTYRARFDSLKFPGLGQFSGKFELSVNSRMYGTEIDMLAEGTGEVFLSDEVSTGHIMSGRKLNGVVNGQSDFSMNMAGFMNVEGSGAFSDTLSGYYFGDFVSVKQKSFQTEGMATIRGGMPQAMIIEGEIQTVNNESTGYLVFAMPGIAAYSEIRGDQVRTELYGFDNDLNLYYLGGGSSPVDDEEIFYYYHMTLLEPELDEIPFQELLEKYFRFYVTAIDSERSKSYFGTAVLDERTGISNRTLEDLMGALSLADQLGISLAVEQSLRLVLGQKDSLFDKWFGLFFEAADGSIVEKLSQAVSPAEEEGLRHQRVQNALDGIMLARMVASEDLIISLGLYPASAFMSGIIDDYFRTAHPLKCASGGPGYQQWKAEVVMLAQMYAQGQVVSFIINAGC